MKSLAATADTWAILLPPDTTWVGRGQPELEDLEAKPLRRAVVTSPWALRRRGKGRTYIAFPSREQPLLVTSHDPAVLRYLTDAVLSAPPGVGGLSGLVMTLGRRFLRRRSVWLLAALCGTARVVSVETR
jgi:hypothetical protein